MSLTRKQIAEIVAFDWKQRCAKSFDGRRYGSVTGSHVPEYTEDWARCRGINPQYDRLGKKSVKPPRKTLRYNYIVPARARRGRRPDVTIVHVAVRLNGAYQPVVKDVARWHISTGLGEFSDMDYRGIAGWIVDWSKLDYAGKRPGKGPFVGERLDHKWYSLGDWKFGSGTQFPWHATVNLDALKGTRYEWCQYEDAAPVGLVDWLTLYSLEPKVELLAKAGLRALVNPSGLAALKDRRVFDYARSHVAEIEKAGRQYETRHNLARVVAYAAKRNLPLKAAFDHYELVRHVSAQRRFCGTWPKNFRLDYERIEKLLPKWKVSAAEFIRYLELCRDVGLDLRNDGTVYPPVTGGRKAFMARLEATEAELARKRRAEARAAKRAEAAERKRLAEMMAVRADEIAAFQESLERVKTLRGCGYRLVLAKSQKELLAEGRRMHNCVGCGIYGDGVAKGDCLIVMLRDADGNAYCDIEIRRWNWSVRQCYLKHNQSAPKDLHELAREIAAALKAEHKRHVKKHLFANTKGKAAA